MISCYPTSGDIAGASWIDLFDATDEERRQVEQERGLRVPARASIEEIEATSRAYAEKGALYLSTSLPTRTPGSARVDTQEMHEGSGVTYVGFVLSDTLLLTVRFASMPAFDLIAQRAREEADDTAAPWDMLLRIVEKIVDLTADRLEAIAAGLAEISHATFRTDSAEGGASGRRARRLSPAKASLVLRAALRRLGTIGDMLWEVRDSLTGMLRIAHRLGRRALGPVDGRPGGRGSNLIMLDLKSLERQPRAALRQGAVPPRRDPRLHQHRAERHRADADRRLGRRHPPGSRRGRLRDELPAHAGAVVEASATRWRSAAIVVTAIIPVVWFKARGWM